MYLSEIGRCKRCAYVRTGQRSTELSRFLLCYVRPMIVSRQNEGPCRARIHRPNHRRLDSVDPVECERGNCGSATAQENPEGSCSLARRDNPAQVGNELGAERLMETITKVTPHFWITATNE